MENSGAKICYDKEQCPVLTFTVPHKYTRIFQGVAQRISGMSARRVGEEGWEWSFGGSGIGGGGAVAYYGIYLHETGYH